jgi:hypothetical protein
MSYGASGTCGGEACGASATVTTGAGTVTVVLTDTQANPRSAGDLLSNFHIALPGSPTGLTQNNQPLITVNSNTGPYTTSTGTTQWEVSTSGGVITLDVFSHAVPINMIIGPPDSSGNYSNGNASVVDGHFSPYINGTGTFVFSDTSITAATALPTSVTFSFGTMLNESTLTGFVPLPPAALLFGTALVGMGILGRRRRNNGVAQS